MATAQLNESLFGRDGRNIYKSGLLIKKSSIVSSTGEDRDRNTWKSFSLCRDITVEFHCKF